MQTRAAGAEPRADPNAAAAAGAGAGEFITNSQVNVTTQSAAWEYNMVRWLEKEGYDVTYSTNVDTHAAPGLLLQHKGFLSVGHDEYWSQEMRENVKAARDNGVGLAFFSSNSCYRKIWFEADSNNAPNRTVATGPSKIRWRDEGLPEGDLIGVMYDAEDTRFVDANVVVADASNWVFGGTGLQNGGALSGLLGYEVDRNYNLLAGEWLLARSPYGVTNPSDMSLYTAASGAPVFATGTMQWAWGLDDYNAPALRTPRQNAAAQRMTRNVLNRLARQWVVPGVIQAEDFNEGGEGAAYHDDNAGNNGVPYGGDYRGPTDVDIAPTADKGGGYCLAWVHAGEWLRYSINVGETRAYTFEARVASDGVGGTFHVEIDGENVTGSVRVPDTHGWDTWQTISLPNVALTAGTHTMRVVMDSNGAPTPSVGNINYFRIAP